MPLAPLRLLALLLIGALSLGGTADEALDRVEAGLLASDADRVLDGAEARVEVMLFGQGGTYRHGQAAQVLVDFFRRYPPQRVAFGELATSDDGRAAMGRYWTLEGGAPLAVRALHRRHDGEWRLASLRIDRASFGSVGALGAGP